MSSPVKPRRPYDASRRQEQARRTRLVMVQAAHRLFLERGYSATTMPAVAEAAGVSVQSVYKAFGNKAALLKTVFDVAMAGDDEAVPMLQRAALGRVRDEPDPRRKLELYGEFVAEVTPRHVPVQLLARAAAATDPEAAGVWGQLQAERLAGLTMFARALHDEGHLRPDVPVEEARDLLWTCNSPETYDLLVLQRGWTPERYGRWVADTLIAALLP
jgi:TetR/AcrR family transcriptional regulator, regulator of autoinduction and epiphytic fitness